jgi:hypothetical protein
VTHSPCRGKYLNIQHVDHKQDRAEGSYLYPCPNTTPSRPRLQHLLPKINAPAPMSVSHPSSIRPFLIFKTRHHAFSNAFSSKRETSLLLNDDVLPTADVFTECLEENPLPNGALLPNLAHRSVLSLYQFLVLTHPFNYVRLSMRMG